MKRDTLAGLIIGILVGLFLIPTIKNLEFFDAIPSPYIVLLIALPLASAAGVWVARIIGRHMLWVWQVAKFGLVGVLNTAIDFGVLNILIFATGFTRGLPLAALNVVSFTTALVNSYWWNKRWVFEGRGGGKETTQFLEFIIISVLAALISSGIIGGLTTYIPPSLGLSAAQWANAAKAVAVVFSFVWNFLGYKFIVFRRTA